MHKEVMSALYQKNVKEQEMKWRKLLFSNINSLTVDVIHVWIVYTIGVYVLIFFCKLFEMFGLLILWIVTKCDEISFFDSFQMLVLCKRCILLWSVNEDINMVEGTGSEIIEGHLEAPRGRQWAYN